MAGKRKTALLTEEERAAIARQRLARKPVTREEFFPYWLRSMELYKQREEEALYEAKRKKLRWRVWYGIKYLFVGGRDEPTEGNGGREGAAADAPAGDADGARAVPPAEDQE